MNRKVIFKVNANPQIGYGHFRRCIALATYFQENDLEIFLQTNHSNPLINSIKTSIFKKIYFVPNQNKSNDFDSLFKVCKANEIKWVVLDGYEFKEDFEKKFQLKDIKLFRIEDTPRYTYWADIILSQNYGAEFWDFKSNKDCKLALGLDYFLASKELRSWNNQKKIPNNDTFKIVVSLGGASEISGRALEKLICYFKKYPIENLKVFFIITDKSNLEFYQKNNTQSIKYIEFIGFQQNIFQFFSEANFVLTSAGSTMWELIYLGIPFGIIPLNQEQSRYATFIKKEELCFVLPDAELLDENYLKSFFETEVLVKYKFDFYLKKFKILMSQDRITHNLNELIKTIKRS